MPLESREEVQRVLSDSGIAAPIVAWLCSGLIKAPEGGVHFGV